MSRVSADSPAPGELCFATPLLPEKELDGKLAALDAELVSRLRIASL